jgi:catechol-2,3-dioxygenase
VASLKELLTFYRRIKERNLPIKYAFNHIASLAFYFEDPEGHLIEIYWATNVRRARQPIGEPIDFDVPEEELLRELERRGKTVTVDAATEIADRAGVAASGHDARGRASQGQTLPG